MAADHTTAPPAQGLLGVSLVSLGVVYGDIETSPLYALRECFSGPHAVAPTEANVLGVLSLIVWALILIISIKYLLYVTRADLQGEGGILALTALACPPGSLDRRRTWVLVAIGLFGAALLYGDGMITPAISVLSAMEGLEVAAPGLDPYVVPLTIGILLALFALQKRGTAGIGSIFGPVSFVWFVVIAVLGASEVVEAPHVLRALDPRHGVRFFVENGFRGFGVLGAVFLVVTGGEALYADMGHFGIRPIRFTWFTFVFPALALNYFGQGALLLRVPEASRNPFYALAPSWAIFPLIGLATLATIIASQAVISGAFSLSRQAMMLGYLPRMRVEHTSRHTVGQIYVPTINWVLLVFTVGLVLSFRSSSRLAGAYGIAVTTTMAVTTILAHRVAASRWNWGLWAFAVTLPFLAIDLAFLGANALKIVAGGWFPLAVAAAVFTVMSTWKRGRSLLAERFRERSIAWEDFLGRVRTMTRVPGTAVYMTSGARTIPPALVRNALHHHAVHRTVLLLHVETLGVPRVPPSERWSLEELGDGFARLKARFGFSETPNVPKVLDDARASGVDIDPDDTTYFLGLETLLPSRRKGMAIWRERLFALMSRNAQRATAFFHIPTDQVVEVGTQIEL